MAYEHILVDREDGVGIVTLNRPDKLNAMNRKLSSELREAVKAFDADDAIGCIVITGAGERAFSAGGDIHEQRRTIAATRSRNWRRGAVAAVTRSPPAPSRRSA
jgi:enoyl-CoA hydratase/carnithine racemase